MSVEYDHKQVEVWLKRAIDMALEAGNIVLNAVSHQKQIDEKLSSADLVTLTDKQVEDFIHSLVKDDGFIGEESRKDALSDRPTWVIDPVDGTTNFIHSFPFFCISIGLLVNKEPIVGAVFNVSSNTLYYAGKGFGCRRVVNQSAVNVGDGIALNGGFTNVPDKLQNALVLTEFGSSKIEHHLQPKLEMMSRIMKPPVAARGIRCLGSAALQLCAIAEGCGDIYYEAGIHVWDICAGIVIVKEAGGLVRNWDHEVQPYDFMARDIVAVRGSTGDCKGQSELLREFDSIRINIPYSRD
jgi:fructose-1,6-bisphosphatase/inositol monophosphatase family enzyme